MEHKLSRALTYLWLTREAVLGLCMDASSAYVTLNLLEGVDLKECSFEIQHYQIFVMRVLREVILA